jgi:hypothetical protein
MFKIRKRLYFHGQKQKGCIEMLLFTHTSGFKIAASSFSAFAGDFAIEKRFCN